MTTEVKIRRDWFPLILTVLVIAAWIGLDMIDDARTNYEIRVLREDMRAAQAELNKGARYALGDHLPERDCEENQGAAIRRVMEDLGMHLPLEDRPGPWEPIPHRPEIYKEVVECEQWAHESHLDLQKRLAKENSR